MRAFHRSGDWRRRSIVLDPPQRAGFAIAMDAAPSPSPQPHDEPPPLGSWSRTYAAVAAVAVLVMLLLWWLTATFQVPLGSAK